MDRKSIVIFTLLGILTFSYSFTKIMGITPCFLCFVSRWMFWLALAFIWMSFFSFNMIYVSVGVMILNIGVSIYHSCILFYGISPSICSIGAFGSCTEVHKFLSIPTSIWCGLFSLLVLSMLCSSIKEE